MDPEGANLLTYSTIRLRYAPPVHKYSSLRSTAHRAAPGEAPRIVLQQAAVMHAALHALRRQYTAQYRGHLIR